jgi:tetratricopeptide (TPR) repeat protein
LVLVTGDKSTLQKAKGLTHKNNVSKESAILDMNYLSHKLNKIETVELLDVSFKELEQKEKKFNNDIDYSRWLNVVAESHLLNQDLDKASSLLKRSVSNSRSNGLALDELDATILKGQSFYLAGDFEQAYSDYKSALNLCKMIAQNTGSEDDKKFFMGKPKVRLLAEQIKILSQKFGIKQKAGV